MNSTPAADNARAILRPHAGAGAAFALTRHDPSPALAPFVDYHWVIEWDLTDRPDHVQRVLPSPSVHLSIEPRRARITGITTTFDFAEALSGRGRVLGVRFRPGGLRPFLSGPVSMLTDREVGVEEHFDVDVAQWRERVLAAPSPAAAAATADDVLTILAPSIDPVVDEIAAIVDGIRNDPALTRVDAVAQEYGIGVRRLQRLFTEYVGIGPKWVIRCYRLHEVAGRAASGAEVDWAGLAAELGYSDQAHLVREFTAIVGEPPARYARTAGPAPSPTVS
ncbi:MAG: helix-turn-helix domain-containing protein [Actinomycetota bacterium]|nr:helix-turn-helix domain-containing protein [Actinomycetota bacterium]